MKSSFSPTKSCWGFRPFGGQASSPPGVAAGFEDGRFAGAGRFSPLRYFSKNEPNLRPVERRGLVAEALEPSLSLSPPLSPWARADDEDVTPGSGLR